MSRPARLTKATLYCGPWGLAIPRFEIPELDRAYCREVIGFEPLRHLYPNDPDARSYVGPYLAEDRGNCPGACLPTSNLSAVLAHERATEGLPPFATFEEWAAKRRGVG